MALAVLAQAPSQMDQHVVFGPGHATPILSGRSSRAARPESFWRERPPPKGPGCAACSIRMTQDARPRTASARWRCVRWWRGRRAARHPCRTGTGRTAAPAAPGRRTRRKAAAPGTPPSGAPPRTGRSAGSRTRRWAWRDHRSGASGMSTPPLMPPLGPSAPGLMSKSKISVGSHNVAQELGMSTTPLMCPCTGAVPRME